LKITFVSDDWLFIERYVIKADGRTYTIEADYDEVERDNGEGGVWEWYDKPLDDNSRAAVKAMAEGDDVILRYEGKQYKHDRTITKAEKQALREVLAAYKAQN
jgi:hypothetical protein